MTSRALTLCALACSVASLRATTADFATPALDKWLYPNVPSMTSGTTGVAPVFAFLNSTDEDRLGSMLVGFNTAASIPTGLGASSYAVSAVKLTIAIASDDTFLYDPTHDSYRTSLPTTDTSYLADSDVGKPIEVFGVGLRNGYTKLSASINANPALYNENSAYATSGATIPRNAFPLGKNTAGIIYDVADNVGQRQEAIPFGVGTTTEVNPGNSVLAGTHFIFNLTLTDADILAYVQNALRDGILGLFISSLSPAESQTGPQSYPRIFTKEGAPGAEYTPQLQIVYSIVPEPSPALSLALGLGVLAAGRAFGRRHYFS